MLVLRNTVQACTNLSLLCAKGGGSPKRSDRDGGIVSRYFHFADTSYRWLYNPSVGSADSPPFAQGGLFVCTVSVIPHRSAQTQASFVQKEVDRPSVAIETEELSADTFILQILHIVGYTIPQSLRDSPLCTRGPFLFVLI